MVVWLMERGSRVLVVFLVLSCGKIRGMIK